MPGVLLRRMLSDREHYCRSFLVYLPNTHKQDKKMDLEVVVLLHGTNETIFDTELVFQHDHDQQGAAKMGWMELADREGLAVIVPQSRGLHYGNKIYYGWQPGNQDLAYLQAVLEMITSNSYCRDKKLKQTCISNKNISVVGFSNGGLMTSDLYLAYTSSTSRFQISCFVNYMGGIEATIPSRQAIQLNKQLRENTPMVIMSCKRDDNYGPCRMANTFLEAHGCNVCFVDVGENRHQFRIQAVEYVYGFLYTAKQVGKVNTK